MELQPIQSKIYEIRGQRVMLDFDLAELYQVETRQLIFKRFRFSDPRIWVRGDVFQDCSYFFYCVSLSALHKIGVIRLRLFG